MSESRHPGNPGEEPIHDWEALARHFSGEATPEESARVESLLASHPEEARVLASLEAALAGLRRDIPADLDVERALAQVRTRIRLDERPQSQHPEDRNRRINSAPAQAVRWRVPLPAMAAAALLAVGLTSWLALRDRQPEQALVEQPRMLATGVGVRDSLTLPDGTRVILGPMSSVSLRSGYGSDNRELVMRGDAWFDVAHDGARPFTVWAGDATIVDIGTTFTVRSDSVTGVEVAVTRGSVNLRRASTSATEGVILEAGDNGILQNDGQVIARRDAVTDDDLAWMQGKLVFREASVNEVIASLRRWYGIELRVDASLMNRHITATFDGEPADRVVEVIRLVLGAELEKRGDTVVVRPSGGRKR